MARDGLGTAINELADAGAKQHGANQASPGTNGVNDGGASEVDETELAQPTTVPLPGTGDRIDDGGEHQGEHHELAELDALSHQTGNDGGGGAGESSLEEEINSRDEGRLGDHFRGDRWVKEQTSEIEPAVVAVAVHQRIADEPVGRHGQGEHEQVLGEDVDRVFLTAHPCFDHGEAGVHEDHQDRCDEQPKVVGQKCSVEFRHLGSFGREVEQAQTEQRHGDASQPGQRTVGGQATELIEHHLGCFKQGCLPQSPRHRPRQRRCSHKERKQSEGRESAIRQMLRGEQSTHCSL